jgi:hypothetical protein
LAIINNGTVGLPVLEIFPEEVPGILKRLSPGFLIISCLLEEGKHIISYYSLQPWTVVPRCKKAIQRKNEILKGK